MSKKIYDYLSEIEQRNKVISKQRECIRKKDNEYKNTIARPTQSIERQQNQIQKIKDIEILAEVKEIANQLAKRWGSSSNLEISFGTTFAYTTKYQEDANDFVNNFNGFCFRKYDMINILFTERKEGGLSRSTSLTAPIRLYSIQADGKTLLEHLIPKSTSHGYTYDLDVEIDDISQLVLPFKLENLIELKGDSVVPANENSSAILDAAEIYRQKQLESSKM